MDRIEAERVAAFANQHDGGVPMPRADVAEIAGRPGRYAVDIRSLTQVSVGGGQRWTEIDSDRVYSMRGAARILGY